MIKSFFVTLLAFISAFIMPVNAQRLNLPEPDYVKYNDIYILTTKTYRYDDINKTTMLAILGKPVKVKKEWDEINEKFYKNYVFSGGEINFIDAPFLYMEVKTNKWALRFKIRKGFTKYFRIGDKAINLKNTFPKSWSGGDLKGLTVFLKTPDGIPADAYISFTFKDGYIKDIIITQDNS